VVLDPIHPSISQCLPIEIDKSHEIFTRFSGLSFRSNTRIARFFDR
jgi:hypothetical protein